MSDGAAQEVPTASQRERRQTCFSQPNKRAPGERQAASQGVRAASSRGRRPAEKAPRRCRTCTNDNSLLALSTLLGARAPPSHAAQAAPARRAPYLPGICACPRAPLAARVDARMPARRSHARAPAPREALAPHGKGTAKSRLKKKATRKANCFSDISQTTCCLLLLNEKEKKRRKTEVEKENRERLATTTIHNYLSIERAQGATAALSTTGIARSFRVRATCPPAQKSVSYTLSSPPQPTSLITSAHIHTP